MNSRLRIARGPGRFTDCKRSGHNENLRQDFVRIRKLREGIPDPDHGGGNGQADFISERRTELRGEIRESDGGDATGLDLLLGASLYQRFRKLYTTASCAGAADHSQQ